MAIAEGYKANFTVLQAACAAGHLGLVECVDKATGLPVIAVCAIAPQPDGGVIITPVAKMFDADPYEELLPPQ